MNTYAKDFVQGWAELPSPLRPEGFFFADSGAGSGERDMRRDVRGPTHND